MKINSPADDKIIVDLTKQDMVELNITYEDMDYSTIETRRVIWTLLDEAGKALGKDLDPSRRMIIEATPKSEGGCILSFTILDIKRKVTPAKQLLKKQYEKIICEFESLDALYLAAEKFTLSSDSSLYEKNGKYRLIIDNFLCRDAVKHYFSEFSRILNSDNLVFEHTKEHWNMLIPENAIRTLCKN